MTGTRGNIVEQRWYHLVITSVIGLVFTIIIMRLNLTREREYSRSCESTEDSM